MSSLCYKPHQGQGSDTLEMEGTRIELNIISLERRYLMYTNIQVDDHVNPWYSTGLVLRCS